MTVGRLLLILLGPVVIYVASLWLKKALWRVIERNPHADAGMSALVSTLGFYGALFLGFGLWLQSLGVNLTSVAVFTGAVGVGIGLGLQDVAKNFIGGLVILFTRPIKPGDRVLVEGRVGDVRKVNTYSTTIDLLDLSVLILPNSMVLNGDVVNYTFDHRQHQFDITFRVPFDASVEEVEAVMLAAAAEHPDILEDPAPAVRMNAFTDAGVEFSMWVTVAEVRRWVRARSELNSTILSRFREKGWGFGVPLRQVTQYSGGAE